MSNAAKHRKKAAEFEQLKQIDRAIASYVRAIEESESDGEDVDVALLNKVGDLALRQGRVPDAVTYYERAVEHYATAGLFNNAIALCNKILRNAPGRSNVYFTLGRICGKKGLRGDATRNFLEYAARMQQEGRVEEAMRALSEVAELMPELTEVSRLVEEHAARAGVQLPRRRTPLATDAIPDTDAPRYQSDKSSNLVFLDVDYGASSARRTPPYATRSNATPVAPTPESPSTASPTPAASRSLPFIELNEAVDAPDEFKGQPSASTELSLDAVDLGTLDLIDLDTSTFDSSTLDSSTLDSSTLDSSTLDSSALDRGHDGDSTSPELPMLDLEPVELPLIEWTDAPSSATDLELTGFDDLLALDVPNESSAEELSAFGLDVEAGVTPDVDVEFDAHVDAGVDAAVDAAADADADADAAVASRAVYDPRSGSHAAADAALSEETLSDADFIASFAVDAQRGSPATPAQSPNNESVVASHADAHVDDPSDSRANAATELTSETKAGALADALFEHATVSAHDAVVTSNADRTIASTLEESVHADALTNVDAMVEANVESTIESTIESYQGSTLDAGFAARHEHASDLSDATDTSDVPVDPPVAAGAATGVSLRDLSLSEPVVSSSSPAFSRPAMPTPTRSASRTPSRTPLRSLEIPSIEAAIEAGAQLVARMAADTTTPQRRPPYRLDPHDFILPGELPPLLVDDDLVNAGLDRAIEREIAMQSESVRADAQAQSVSPVATPAVASVVVTPIATPGTPPRTPAQTPALTQPLAPLATTSATTPVQLTPVAQAIDAIEGDAAAFVHATVHTSRESVEAPAPIDKRVEAAGVASDLVDAAESIVPADHTAQRAVDERVGQFADHDAEHDAEHDASLGTTPVDGSAASAATSESPVADSVATPAPTDVALRDVTYAEVAPSAVAAAEVAPVQAASTEVALDPPADERAGGPTNDRTAGPSDDATDGTRPEPTQIAERSAVRLTPALPIAAVAAEAKNVAVSRRDELRAAVAAEPQDWGLRRRLAEALFEAGQRDAGLAEMEAALNGFAQSGQLEAAADLSEELARIAPDRVAYHQKRVELAVRLKDQQRLRFAYLDLADTLVRSGEEGRAQAVYVRVLEIDPRDDRARAALGSAAPPLPAPAAAPVAEGFVNLADWLREDDGPASTRMRMREPEVSGDEQADFDALLRHFKEGVSRSLGEEDYESRYDLGVAFKEMGLLDDAIAEFQKALRSKAHRLPAYEALGQCFVEQGRFQIAATVLSRALHEPGLNDEQRIGVLYLLAYSCEALQRWGEARSYFQRVYATDINFRDVAARLAALEQVAS